MPEGVVEQDRNLASGRRHGLCFARTRGQPTIKCSERRIASPDGRSRQPQQRSCPTGRSSCARREHLAAGDFVTRCQAQPGGEVLGERPCPQIRPHSPTSFSASDGPNPWISVKSTPRTLYSVALTSNDGVLTCLVFTRGL